MPKELKGNRAHYLGGVECRWVRGRNADPLNPANILQSTSFGSCVGLVLYNATANVGVVAHFAGSLGKKGNLHIAQTDTVQIVVDAKELGAGNWTATLFGGINYNDIKGNINLSNQTGDLIKCVVEELQKNSTITVNVEDVGHFGVQLNLLTGGLTWETKSATVNALID